MRRRRDSVSVMPRRISASGPGRTDDDRNEEGTSDLEVTAGRVARPPSRGPRCGPSPPRASRAHAVPSAPRRPPVRVKRSRRRPTHHEEPPTNMTSRPRPTTHSKTWDDRERRATLLNLGFGLVVIAALLLLLIAWGVSWYNDHLSAAGTVNGQTITKDAWSKQVAINEFRADYQKRRIRTLLAAGQISAADAENRNAALDQRLQQVDALSLEQLVDGTIQAQLAASQGVTVTPADIDASLKQEATTPELRHAWMIEVAPELASGASQAHRPGRRRRTGQGRPGGSGPEGRQGLGDRRQVRVHRREQGAGRRSRLHRQGLDPGPRVRRGTAGCVQGRPHRRGRGQRRQVPHRPRDGDRRPGRGRDADRPGHGRGHQPRRLPRRARP